MEEVLNSSESLFTDIFFNFNKKYSLFTFITLRSPLSALRNSEGITYWVAEFNSAMHISCPLNKKNHQNRFTQ